MIIYPTLELQNGRCVTLKRGRLEEESFIWHVDPVETAQGFSAAGASWVHITDFDSVADSGSNNNTALIEELIRTTGASIQLAGGLRSKEQVEMWIDKGVGRVVLGTLAAWDPLSVKDLANRYPDQIVLAADIWQGQLMTDGWRTPAAIQPEDFIQSFADVPLAGVLITDIDSDIDQPDAQLGVLTKLASSTAHHVIAAGTVHGPDDVARLKYVPNISGALIGRALFNKNVDLDEAIAIARPEPEAAASFV